MEVAQNLAFLGRELAALTDGLAELEQEMVTSREDYIMAYNKAYLTAGAVVDEGGKPPPVAVREATALLATHAERMRAEGAEARVRQRKAQIASIGKRGNWGQSIGAILKSEMEQLR